MCNSAKHKFKNRVNTPMLTGIPCMAWVVPIIATGIFLSSTDILTSTNNAFLLYPGGLAIGAWTVYIWRTHKALASATSNRYRPGPIGALVLALAGSPLVAWLAQ